jgi:monoamine oxidase
MSRSLYAALGRRFAPDRFNTSRREAIKAALAASAGLLLSGPAFAFGGRAGKRVVIVGAGFSGLACAYELLAAGYDVTVVEARNRVGGRALSFSDMIPGKNIEGGGELIGSNHPTWVAYAKKFNLEFLDVSEHEDWAAPLVLGGKRIDDAQAKKLFESMDEAFSKMNADAAPVVEDEPWTTPNAAALDKKTTADWIKALELDDLGKAGVAAELTANNGVATPQQSYLGNLSQVKGGGLEKYWSDSEVYRCKGGNDLLAKALAKEVGKNRLVLDLPVKSIDVRRDGATVTCADGRTLDCDDVVLTVPPSVWKKIAITPSLPAVLAPQMGVNVKFLAVVKSRFWEEKKISPDTLSDGDISMTWESTDAQSAEGNCGLTAFSGGPAASACRERDKEAREKSYKDQLNSIYAGFSDNYVSSRFMDWPSDPWTQAGYSFPAPGQITTMGPTLRQGLGHLHFAGEHTCYKFVGYMEGGLNSGASLARRLAARDNIIIEPKPAPKEDAKPAEKKEGAGASR